MQFPPAFYYRSLAQRRQANADTYFGCTVVKFLGGNVPKREGQPTAVLPGRTRKPRATQVVASRADAKLVFEVIGRCMGYTTEVVPQRGLLLGEGMEFLTFPSGSRWPTLSGVLTLPSHFL